MDATATPRGISLAVGELGARGRPTFYMTSRTAVSVNWIRSLRPSTVFVDVCPRDTHTPHGLSCFSLGQGGAGHERCHGRYHHRHRLHLRLERAGAREVDAAALRRPRSRLAHRAARASDYDGVVAEGLGQGSRSCSTMDGDGGWSCNGVSCGAVVCCRARVAGVRVEGTFSPLCY